MNVQQRLDEIQEELGKLLEESDTLIRLRHSGVEDTTLPDNVVWLKDVP
jgi:hypothetical protein